MDYEQKYNEALGRAKQLYSEDCSAENKDTCEFIFPELRESEDERIINQLITLVNSTGEVLLIPTNKEELVAWLNKCKESLRIPELCKENADSFTDEDERIRKDIIKTISWIVPDCQYAIVLPREQKDKWLAWLEKQKEPKPDIEICPHSIKSKSYSITGYPCEWSEEDEKNWREVIKCIKSDKLLKQLYDIWERLCYPKSLRPSWKPSEEQMEAFRSYIKDFQEKAEAAVRGWNNFDVMIRLYEQLKKLM